MGKYINEDSSGMSFQGRSYKTIIAALQLDGATILSGRPGEWCENLVVVVDNTDFGAALFVADEREFRRVANSQGRATTYLIYEHAKTLSLL